MFHCVDSFCISRHDQVCNGVQDCIFGEDETNCETNCNHSVFCDDLCLPVSRVCDKHVDCSGGEDEVDCSYPTSPDDCHSGEFYCSNSCIPSAWRCDGDVDCGDGSDEENCFECPERTFDCGDGSCIQYTNTCDGISQCENGLDESSEICELPKPEPCVGFQCTNMVCINASMICDGIVHCNDGDDEGEHCSHLTGETEDDCSGIWCPLTKSPTSSGCVRYSSVCDGEAQCANDLDESNCPVWSSWAEWSPCSVTCGSGRTRRERHCDKSTNSTLDCNGQRYQDEPCFLKDCHSNVTWSQWSSCSGKTFITDIVGDIIPITPKNLN